MKIKAFCFAAAGCVLLAGCGAGLKKVVVNGKIAPKFEDTRLDKEFLWVRGFGAANPKYAGATQKMAMSREAAIANAYQRAVEYVKGAGLVAKVRVQDAKDSAIETKVKGLVRGGAIVLTEFTDEGDCCVVLRLPRDKFKDINIEFPGLPGK